MAQSLQIVAEVEVDKATGNLKVLGASIDQVVKGAGRGFGDLGKAAKGAGDNVISLGDRFKQFAREERQEARTAGFFVKELSEIVPMGEKVKGALTQIGGALVGGGAFGLGLATATVAIGALVHQFTAQGDAAKAALDETVKWGETVRKEAETAAEALRLYNAERAGGAFGRTKAKGEGEVGAAEAKFNEAAARVMAARKALADLQVGGFRGLSGAPLGEDAAKKDLDEAIANEQAAAAALRDIRERTAGETEDAESKAAEDSQKAFEDSEKKKTDALRAEQEKRLKSMQEYIQLVRAYGDSESANMVWRGDNPEIARMRKEALAQAHAKDTGGLGVGSVGAFAEMDQIDPADMARRAADEQKAYNEELRRSSQEAQAWGSTLGQVFGGIITGQMSVGKAVTQVGQQIIQMTIQAAIASIQADAAALAVKSGKSVADVPVFGPVLAISTMGAMLSAALAYMSNVPSAAGGWRVPDGVNPMTQLHAGEHVIPRALAQKYERGAGGGGTTINVAAVDAPSVERLFKRQGRDIVRSLERQRRRGRI